MKRLFRLVSILYALSGATFAFLSGTGRLAFGYGLGDLFYHVAHVVGYLLLLAAVWAVGKAEGPDWVRPGQLLRALLLILMLLHVYELGWQLTVGRGVEYSWNGRLFYS
jgi:hypothetical protein